MDDDRVLVESGAEMTPVPHEPSEFEKQKHNLTHIPFQLWCTSCVQGRAQAEPHKRTERIIEDSELPMIQCDYLMLKDVAGTCGLKVLSMYVRTFGYGMSTVVETKGPTDMFATMWAVKVLNFLDARFPSVCQLWCWISRSLSDLWKMCKNCFSKLHQFSTTRSAHGTREWGLPHHLGIEE